MHVAPFVTKVVCSLTARGEVYSIQLYILNLLETCGGVVSPSIPVYSTNNSYKSDRHERLNVVL